MNEIDPALQVNLAKTDPHEQFLVLQSLEYDLHDYPSSFAEQL